MVGKKADEHFRQENRLHLSNMMSMLELCINNKNNVQRLKKMQTGCIFRRFRTSILFSAGQRPHGFGQISLSFHNSISHKRRTGCPAADSFHDPCTPAPQKRHSIQPFTLQPTLSFLKTGYLCKQQTYTSV